MSNTTVTAAYPGSIVTDSLLPFVGNDGGSSLESEIDSDDLTLTVQDITDYTVPCIVRVGQERMLVTAKTSVPTADNALRGTLTVSTRAYDGSTAVTHKAGSVVRLSYVAYLHNRLRVELIAVQTKLGTSATSGVVGGVLFADSSGNFAQDATNLFWDDAANELQVANVDVDTGVLKIGGVTLFENDRDLAVSLIPNAATSLNLGSTTRPFQHGYLGDGGKWFFGTDQDVSMGYVTNASGGYFLRGDGAAVLPQGLSDYGPAIDAAIAAGFKHVILPTGTLPVVTVPALGVAGVRLEGQGRTLSVFTYSGASALFTISVVGDDYTHFAHFGVDATGSTGDIIHITDGRYVRLEALHLQNAGRDAIHIEFSILAQLQQVQIDRPTRHGLALIPPGSTPITTLWARDTSIRYAVDDAVVVHAPMRQFVWTGGDVEFNDKSGFVIGSGGTGSVDGVHIEDAWLENQNRNSAVGDFYSIHLGSATVKVNGGTIRGVRYAEANVDAMLYLENADSVVCIGENPSTASITTHKLGPNARYIAIIEPLRFNLDADAASIYSLTRQAETTTRKLTIKNTGAGTDPFLSSNSSTNRLNISGPVDVAGSVRSSVDGSNSLGTSGQRWGSAYVNAYFVTQTAGDANPVIDISTGGIKFGAGGASAVDVQLLRGAANRLDLASGDSFNIVSGNLQFGAVTLFEADRDLAVTLLPNADASLNLGSAARQFAAAWLSGTLTLGGDVGVSRGAADRLDLATGDSLNLVSGSLQFGGTTLFEADRDLAVTLLPNADGTLDLGSTTRAFATGHINSLITEIDAVADAFADPADATPSDGTIRFQQDGTNLVLYIYSSTLADWYGVQMTRTA